MPGRSRSSPRPDDLGNGWTVITEDFVSAEDGTGIVHIAPAFGSDDYAAGQRHDLPMLRPVDDAGRFVEGTELVAGMFVKDADSVLVEALESRGECLPVRHRRALLSALLALRIAAHLHRKGFVVCRYLHPEGPNVGPQSGCELVPAGHRRGPNGRVAQGER